MLIVITFQPPFVALSIHTKNTLDLIMVEIVFIVQKYIAIICS